METNVKGRRAAGALAPLQGGRRRAAPASGSSSPTRRWSSSSPAGWRPGCPSHVEEADLISYGLLGLIGAIERFDPEREIKFETFAIARIKGAIIDELRSLDWVPRSVRARAREIEQAHAEARARAAARADRRGDGRRSSRSTRRGVPGARCSRSPTPRSLALDELWTVVRRLAATRSRCSTRSRTRAPSTRRPRLDVSELKDRLADAIESLPEREKLVVALYYYENLTLREIGEVLGVTESRVSQLHTKAVLRPALAASAAVAA